MDLYFERSVFNMQAVFNTGEVVHVSGVVGVNGDFVPTCQKGIIKEDEGHGHVKVQFPFLNGMKNIIVPVPRVIINAFAHIQ